MLAILCDFPRINRFSVILRAKVKRSRVVNIFQREYITAQSCKVMIKRRRSRSFSMYRSRDETVANTHRSLSVSKRRRPLKPFTTVIELFRNIFRCPPELLDTSIRNDMLFVRRILQNIFPRKGFVLKGTHGHRFYDLRWITNPNPPTQPLAYPYLPTVVLHHNTNGVVTLHAVPLELFYLPKLVGC